MTIKSLICYIYFYINMFIAILYLIHFLEDVYKIKKNRNIHLNSTDIKIISKRILTSLILIIFLGIPISLTMIADKLYKNSKGE